MGELDKILQEFDIRFADRDDDDDRSEFTFDAGRNEEGMEDDDDRVIDFRGEMGDDEHSDMDFDDGEDMDDDHGDMDFGDEEEDEDTFAGEKRVDITNKLRSMLGLDDDGEEMSDDEQERFTPSLSDLDLDSEDDDEEDGEFDFDVFNKRGAE